MEKQIINTINHGERVTSTYAELYLDDIACKEWEDNQNKVKLEVAKQDRVIRSDEWISPSDALIGIVELKPPFTSKITRGKTHQGILSIGDQVLEKQRIKFLKYLNNLLRDNDAAWNRILKQEREIVENKVKEMYGQIFAKKSKLMTEEMHSFFEKSLQELENHMREELRNVLVCAHASMIKDLNNEIKHKLHNEKVILEDTLKNRYSSEMNKVMDYYKLLMENEQYRHKTLINSITIERNDALKTFITQFEAENTTSTMYVMSMERKKCRIQKFLMQSYQSKEIEEKMQKIKERQSLLDEFNEKDIPITVINTQWEEKIKKVLQLFLKFISFGLKLLPEQSTFLLDLERLFVLQLNEIQKQPLKTPSILIDTDKFHNLFSFEKSETPVGECTMEPFIIEGDLSDPVPVVYGSRETLPSDVDLPVVRLQRQFVYAKCHNFEDIKDHIEAQKCKCHDKPNIESISTSTSISNHDVLTEPASRESSLEALLVEDIHRLQQCPLRKCTNLTKRFAFPNLRDCLDFSEENYTRAKALCKVPLSDNIEVPELLNAKDVAYRKVLFAPTTEPFHNVATQYSSQESIFQPEMGCTCIEPVAAPRTESHYRINDTAIEMKRKQSVVQLLSENPNLLKMFTDENFDFQL